MLIESKKVAIKELSPYFCSDGILGANNCFLMIRKSAMNSAAAAMAEVVPMISHAAHAGIEVCRYLSEPMRMNRAADPANEIPSAINTAPTMLIIKSFLMRFLRAASA